MADWWPTCCNLLVAETDRFDGRHPTRATKAVELIHYNLRTRLISVVQNLLWTRRSFRRIARS